jgi:ubiquinone/menaquinone biosynthesis C-methylase UbiE
VLRNLGLKAGHVVADFGCRAGRYAVPAARIVGKRGRVYAIDRDADSLARLELRASELELDNIHPRRVDLLAESLPLEPHTIDVAFLFDVLHGVFFPQKRQRLALFEKVRRAVKPEGRLAVYPTHGRKHGPFMKQLESEIAEAGFREVNRSRRQLLHDDRLVRGWVLVYRQSDAGRRARTRSRQEVAT